MAGDSPSYGLEGVILHHSFEKVRGRTIRIDCRDRTHVGGSNGEGKSSILSLIPAFYGEEPERIVTKASGKSSFLDYYLPSFQSLIIFEYQRENGLHCSVMFRHAQGKPCYRFVEGSAEETFFSEDCKALLAGGASADEIFAHLRKAGVTVSKTIDTITNYRAIIQRNPRLLKRLPAEAKALRSLASQFGLGDRNSHMTNIDRLTHVVLNRHRLLSSFKSMICETQFESIHVHSRPRAIDRKDLVADIQSLSAFAREEEKIRTCLRKDSERLALLEQSDKTVANLIATVEEDQEKLTGLREQREQLEQQRHALKLEFETAETDRARDLTNAQALHERHEKDLNELYQKHDEYERAGLPERVIEYENLPEIRQRSRAAQEDLEQLTGKVSEIESEYQKELDRLEREHEQQQRSRREKLASAEQELQKEQHAHQLRLTELQRKGAEEVSNFRQERASERTELANEESRLSVLKDSQAQTDEEKEELAQAQEAVDAAVQQVESRQGSLAEALAKRDQVAREANALAQDIEACDKRVQELDDAFLELQKTISPENGTWLSQLRAEDPQWSSRLGKIVHPDLLQSKELSPVFNPSAGTDTVMGWSLALDALPTPEFALTEEELQARSRELDERRAAARAERSEVEQMAKGRQEALKDRNESVNVLETELSLFRRTRDNAQTKLANTRERVNKAVSERAEKYRQQWQDKTQALSDFDTRTAEGVKDLESAASQRVLDTRGHWADREAELSQAVESSEQNIAEAQSEYKERLKTKQTVHEQKLSEEGVDPKVIREARERASALNGKVERLVASEDEVRAYKKWRDQEWINVETLTEKASLAKTEWDRLAQEREEAEREYNRQRKELSGSIDELSSAIKKRAQQIETAQSLLSMFPTETIATGFPGNIVDLVEELQSTYQQTEALRKQVLSNYDQAVRILNDYDGTHIQKAWEKLSAYRKDQLSNDLDVYDEKFKLAQVPDLRKLLDDDIPQLRDAVIDQFVSESGSLVKYFDSLEVMAKEVKAVSSELRRKINTDQKIESLSDIQVVLEPRIYEDETWQPLKEFVEHWQTWRQTNRRTLPDEGILRRFKLVTDTLSDARVKESVESMIDLRLEMKENGRHVVIRTDADFLDASSTGLTYLAIMTVFMGLTRYLCPDFNVRITWPIDELATLSFENISRLADMLEKNNLTMISACPKLDRGLRKFFEHKLVINKGRVHHFTDADQAQTHRQAFEGLRKSTDAAGAEAETL